MNASLENVCTASLGITYTAYQILGRQQTTPFHQDFKLAQFISIPP